MALNFFKFPKSWIFFPSALLESTRSSPLGLQIEMSSPLLDRFMTSSPAGWLDCDLDLDGWMVTDISA